MLNAEAQMQLYLRYSKKARSLEHYQSILQKVEPTIDYRPYGIDKLLGDRALTLFLNLKEKYRKRELLLNLDGWYEREKKVFVWFVVMHTYYLEKEGIRLSTISQFREVINFKKLAKMFFGKSVFFIEFQFLNLIKITEKIIWSQEDDRYITNAVAKNGCGRWADVSRQIFHASKGVKFINPKNCRERWQNHLDDTKIKGNWTDEEDLTILQAVLERHGKKWSKMKGELNYRRTEHMIKNRYNSLITKNKRSRHQREKQISQRVLNQLRNRVYGSRPMINQQAIAGKQESQEQIQQESIILKQQNYSLEEQEIAKMQPLLPEQQLQDQLQSQEQEEEKVEQQPMIKHQSKYSQPLQQDQIYPFQNYSYELQMCNYQQIHEIQINHLLYYQQYMNFHPLPTAETFQNTLEIRANLKAEKQEEAPNLEKQC